MRGISRKKRESGKTSNSKGSKKKDMCEICGQFMIYDKCKTCGSLSS